MADHAGETQPWVSCPEHGPYRGAECCCSDKHAGDSAPLTPEALGLEACDPERTYLDDHDEVWIGAKWDIARTGGTFHVYRKGNWRIGVGTFDLALRIVADGTPHGHCSGGCEAPDSGSSEP